MITATDLKDKLQTLAFDMTDSFCYGCYKIVKEKSCPSCHSDDFMRHLDGVGVEYGTDWVIEHLIKEHCPVVDGEEEYEQMLNECYDPVKIGLSEWEAGYVVKELDPVSFRCGVSDYLADDEEFVEIDGAHYRICDIEHMIEEIN